METVNEVFGNVSKKTTELTEAISKTSGVWLEETSKIGTQVVENTKSLTVQVYENTVLFCGSFYENTVAISGNAVNNVTTFGGQVYENVSEVTVKTVGDVSKSTEEACESCYDVNFANFLFPLRDQAIVYFNPTTTNVENKNIITEEEEENKNVSAIKSNESAVLTSNDSMLSESMSVESTPVKVIEESPTYTSIVNEVDKMISNSNKSSDNVFQLHKNMSDSDIISPI